MCNLYTQSKSVDEIARIFQDLQMPIRFPEGIPNLSPKEIAITDPGPIVRVTPDTEHDYELVMRRWSWPGPNGKPVYNFRSDNREFSSGRCLILADGFYEFTAPSDPRQKRKDRWLFTWEGEGMIGIAGLFRRAPDVGEAFTMLTTEPGPDIAPYHNRQIALLPPQQWDDWLRYKVPGRDLLRPLPAGALEVRAASR
jgi:putative SOS response-associated peptidase YedK